MGVPDDSSQEPWGGTSHPQCRLWDQSCRSVATPVPGSAHPSCVQLGTALGWQQLALGPHTLRLRRHCHQPPAEMQMQRNGRCD